MIGCSVSSAEAYGSRDQEQGTYNVKDHDSYSDFVVPLNHVILRYKADKRVTGHVKVGVGGIEHHGCNGEYSDDRCNEDQRNFR